MIKKKIQEISVMLHEPIQQFTSDIQVQGISIDSRTLISGNLYIAICGEQYDGHDFKRRNRHYCSKKQIAAKDFGPLFYC